MLGGPTRRLHVLWGQTLASYVPPHSPSGLVRGHLLRRYPVSGVVTASSPARRSDAEVEAHVTAAQWLPARTPAEVVLNANEFSTFHAVPTASPEDVRLCTRYLLATSNTSAASVGMENPKLQERNLPTVTFMSDLRDTANSSYEAPSGRVDTASLPFPSIITNLNALRHVLGEHRCLLAGSEALQTGVPISCILAEHEEAQMYLTWSLGSHQSGSWAQGMLPKPSNLACDDDHDGSAGVAAGSREAAAPLTVGCVFAMEEASGGAESTATPHQHLDPRERARRERLARLRRRFQSEVAHLHGHGQRGAFVEAFRGPMPISAEGAQGKTCLPMAEPRVPLLTVATSAGSGLAAAIKAAAVAWACCACEVGGSSASSLRCCVYAMDILWRPAPATALVATWWAALLHQHQSSSSTDNSAENSHSSPSDAAAQHSLERHPPTFTGPASERSEGHHNASVRQVEESSAVIASSLSPCTHNFHVLITGGDTADHFLLPLMAGVDDSIIRTHTKNAHPNERIDVTAQNGDRSGGNLARQRGGDAACASSSAPSVHRRRTETLAMVLCYGCPAAQVAHLHAIRHSYLVQQDMPDTSATAESRGALIGQGDANVTSDGESTAATSGQSDSLPSMRQVDCATTGVVELCTETPAVSMVTVLPHPVLSNATAAAQPMTLKEVAACVFESSLLERPLRHADLRPPLLSTLAESHFGQPLRSGHSFDALCRRGPAPSPTHVHMAQEVLRCATRAFTLPRTCANEGTLKCGVLREVQWKHVCGGFPLPLTAVRGRSSPYFVPCLLFTDLAEVASTIFTKGHEGRLHHAGIDTMEPSWPAALAYPDGHDGLPREALGAGLGASPQATLQYSASEKSRQTQAQVACAVAAVEDSVFELGRTHDTEMLGYRGVVAGNYLFICCYPDAWQDAVKDAQGLQPLYPSCRVFAVEKACRSGSALCKNASSVFCTGNAVPAKGVAVAAGGDAGGACSRPRAALLVVALTLCLLLSPVRGAESPFTHYSAVQKANTRKFLQAFVDANPLLEKLPSVDFCEWVYSECTSKGVDLYLDERAVVQLPEMSSGIVGKYVLVTSINLSYGKNTLKGTLPASWGSLTHLEYISMYSNSLTGTLPPEWANMKSAKWFLLYRNELTGTIPEAWSRLRYMTWACLNDNNLTGTLPSSWGSAPQLTIVEARRNQLTGTLPPTWGSLRKLSSITLTDNNLTGPLPEEWASAQTLYGVSVERNNLCGCVPKSWVSHNFLYGMQVDDSLLAADYCNHNAAHDYGCNNMCAYDDHRESFGNYHSLEQIAHSDDKGSETVQCSNRVSLVSGGNCRWI
ncbi:hypothetical protein CGC21_11495 [Leishmania donovani]|uniref:Uncharacterized protein n=1 Tax=Leishmania donovani TaxID=5661 RepID=A0A504X3B6_LEIDO|nr:hypothetical protein CGC21_11495 [Leishmania donovani]